ncbi:Ig-like domain-containing protein [uncultured Porphyromonas sp.]|uniref:Ig-like domain-containing protein n=1 Tax=uncultured Porphyromonas sp. TaxID=159274 RepID=UPI00260DAB5B|nr:Ig-like domain-containing protein [uncultured Porphyromonas sp.]
MFFKTLPLNVLLLALTLSLIACHKEPPTTPKPPTEPTHTTLSVSPERLSLRAGKHAQLSVSATPADATLRYTYQSTSEAVATVSNQGLVTAVAEGHCTITISAGEAHVTVPVQVLPAVQINAKRYIGADAPDSRFVPIYIPILAEIEQRKDEIQAANEAKDWLLESDRKVPRGSSYALSFIAPSQKGNFTDMRYIKRIAYRYTPGRTDRSFLLLFTEYLSNEDILIKAYQKGKDSEAYDLLKSIAQGYGFTDAFSMTKDERKGPLFHAYCRDRYPEGDLWLCIQSEPASDGPGFGLRLQIATSTVPKR